MEYWSGTVESPVLPKGVQRLFALDCDLKVSVRMFFNTPSAYERNIAGRVIVFQLARRARFFTPNRTKG
jgi:hypothetical protein